MKYFVYIMIAVMIIFAGCSGPSEDIERAQIIEEEVNEDFSPIAPADGVEEPVSKRSLSVDEINSKVEFEGYGPGKSHVGVFEAFTGMIHYDDDGLIESVEVTVDASSVVSDSTALDGHLKAETFFDVQNYPEMIFKGTVDEGAQDMTVELDFRGINNLLYIPIEIVDNSISSEFILSMKEFGIEKTGVNDEVRVAFTFVAAEE